MKMKLLAAGAALCALGMTGCSNETDEPDGQTGKQVVMTLQASTGEPQTRAVYTEDKNDNTKMNFSWRKGDAITVVVDGMKENKNCQLTTQTEGSSAPFSGTVTPWTGEKKIYAFYSNFKINSINSDGSTFLALANPQSYTVGGPNNNGCMVGVGTATANGTAINTSQVSLKQVMSFIKLKIINAPSKVACVKLKNKSSVGGFLTQARVNLNTAEIDYTNYGDKTAEFTMNVTDNTTEATKEISFAIFPNYKSSLEGKNIEVTVVFNSGTKVITKKGLDFKRNTHYVLTVDASDLENYIETRGGKWATGNLIADGAHGAKIGAPNDKGLLFQCGSLIGWSNTGDSPSIEVSPANFKEEYKDWTNDTKIAGGGIVENIRVTPTLDHPGYGEQGYGDPCYYYTEGVWRLPTINEYRSLFQEKESYDNTNGDWRWDDSSKAAIQKSGLILPATIWRKSVDGSFAPIGSSGYRYYYYWTGSGSGPDGISYALNFNSTNMLGFSDFHSGEKNGLPVRCVRYTPTN